MEHLKMTNEQLLAHYKSVSPKDLIDVYEGLADKMYDLADIKQDPVYMFTTEGAQIAIDYAMEAYADAINRVDYGDEVQTLESYVGQDEIVTEEVTVSEAHQRNLRQLLENSVMETRTANANQFNLNQLTPFDAFLPFTIIRSYLPLIGKDLIPTQTPAQPFIRIKQQYKYIVTKDNKKYLRPDIYNDTSMSRTILNTARGAEVTQEFYPAATEAVGDGDFTGPDGKKYDLPSKLEINQLDLLKECGGLTEIGDDLDIDIHVKGIRAKVVDTKGTTHVIEQSGYEAYPDITSISPQRSVSFKVVIPIKDGDGNIVEKVEDKIYGEYNYNTHTFDLVSVHGYVKQVQFGGHMSNKNNMEYLSFTNEFGVTQHPIPEGYNSQVPITKEDMDLYQQTASIDIIATATNEMIEIFTQLEDSSIVDKIDEEFTKWQGKGEGEHNFEHFHGNVVFEKECVIKPDPVNFRKIHEYTQDQIQYDIGTLIANMRDVIKAEPFRLVAFAHPNICRLFTGNVVDWKVTPGAAQAGGAIRNDYSMGIYTANGDSFRIISSQKIKEEDGVRFLVFPVNEQNFLSWKHFKYSMFFSRDYRNPQMSLVPNIKGMSRFYTHSYTPLQAKLYIRNYK